MSLVGKLGIGEAQALEGETQNLSTCSHVPDAMASFSARGRHFRRWLLWSVWQEPLK